MRVAVTASQPTMDAPVDPRFGRCAHFVIVDTDTMAVETVANSSVGLGSGAGIQAGRLLADAGVASVLTGHCGPNAYDTLAAAGIQVVVGCQGSVAEAVEALKAGHLAPAEAPDVGGKHGAGAGP